MAYLILLVSLVVVGAAVVWIRERRERRPQTMESSLSDFERHIAALERRSNELAGRDD